MLETIQRPIQDDLRRYDECFRQALVSDNTLLSAALRHVGQRQGKRMRPTLVLLSALEAGGVCDAVLHAAVGLELLHTASLLHDDVLDESDMRRGQPSVNAIWGDKAAVLVGDYLTSKALQEVTLSGNIRLMERTGWLGQQLADGELEQMDITSDTDFSEPRYYSVIAKKTASLFSTAAFAGALLGGGNDNTIEALEHVGHLIGLCFQMRDDLLDFDNSEQTGKPKFTDLREGKVTLPLIYALNTSHDEAMQQLALKARKGEASYDECHTLAQFAISQGGAYYVEAEMQRLRTEVITITQELHNSDVATSIETYIDYVINRDK